MAGVSGSVYGYNMFSYCFNNPVNMTDNSGTWPSWNDIKTGLKKAVDWVDNNIIQPVVGFVEDAVEYVCNTDEQVVLESKFISFYKGVPVIRTPSGMRSGSFGIIFLSRETSSNELSPEDLVRHEYGHTRQLKELGILNYLITVGIPSYLNLGEKWGGGEYYNKPWEVMANVYGGVEEYKNSRNDINAAYKYYRASQKIGPLVLIFIE